MMPSRRFSLNLLTNVLNFALTASVGAWITPYLILHLGVIGYGLVPLATTLTSYLSLVTVAINSAYGRFMILALDRDDYTRANHIFNTSFWGTVGLLLLILPACVFLSLRPHLLLTVPQGNEADCSYLLILTVATFYITTLTSTFAVSSFCRNRLDLANAVSIVNTLIRVAATVVIFSATRPSVWHVSLALLLASVVSGVCTILLWRRLTPMLAVHLSLFSLGAFRQMTGTGSWILLNTVGTLLYLSIDLIVVNRVLGPVATGQYGAVMTWSTLLRSFAGVVAAVFSPAVLLIYSKGDLSQLVRYSRQSVTFLGTVIAFPVGLICGLSKPILHVWIGHDFAHLAALMSLMTVHLCVNLAVLPLFNIQLATNHVRTPGIVTCVMGILNVVLAVTLANSPGWGMYGVAAAGALMLTAKNLIFTPLYAAHLLHLKWNTFYRDIMPVVIVTLVLSCLGWGLSSIWPLNTLPALIAAGAALSALCGGPLLWKALHTIDRSRISDLLAHYVRARCA